MNAKTEAMLRKLESAPPHMRRTIVAQLVDALNEKHATHCPHSVRKALLDFLCEPERKAA